jgi:hypothetical protein
MKTRSTSQAVLGQERRSAAKAPASTQLQQARGVDMPDARAVVLAQLQHQERAGNSFQAAQLKARADMMAGRGTDVPVQRAEDEELLQGKFSTVQREPDEELLQGKFAPVQRIDDEELLQGKFDGAPLQGGPAQTVASTAPPAAPAQREEKPNNTGLPDQLKSGIESLSGMSMDHVKVHYNSSEPAKLQAHAYAQGSQIHVAPGQERHVPHEAWHVVQQAQGRVKPTMQMKVGVQVNDEVGLETEADVMGAKAMQLRATGKAAVRLPASSVDGMQAVQAVFYRDGEWMQNVAGDVLDSRFASTTRALWKDLQKDGRIVGVDKGGSGASYSFGRKTIDISADWFGAVEAYVKDASKQDAKLMRGTTALTHEMSHAHDHQVRGESPDGASRDKDEWVVAVLKTELRAWMKEARAGIENRKEKEIENSGDDRDLQYSWVALHFIGDEHAYLGLAKNLVIGRLTKYYNDNKSPASNSLAELVAGGLNVLIADYATQIRKAYTSTDTTLRRAVALYMT